MPEILSAKIFDSRIKSEKVEKKEKWLGYQAPTETMIPVQNDAVQKFIIFCVIGVQAAVYPVITLLQLYQKGTFLQRKMET